METLTEDQVIDQYREVRGRYLVAMERADAAFLRWFRKREQGLASNGAAAQRLANDANYVSADLASAEIAVYKLDLNPRAIDVQDGIDPSLFD